MIPTLSISQAQMLYFTMKTLEKGESMMPGGPPIYDWNDHYRILESSDGYFYPQYKGIFRWKFYDHGNKYDHIVAKFASYEHALKFLNEKIDEEKIKSVKFKGKKFVVHKPFRK